MQQPAVAISFPSGDLVHARFAACLAQLCATSQQVGIPFVLVNPRTSIISEGRSLACDLALELSATHVLFLDSDMTFPDTLLRKLLSHRKQVVGCQYKRRVAPYQLLGEELKGGRKEGNLVEMQFLPTGALLFKTEVLAELPRPFFRFEVRNEKLHGEDVLFCEALRARGIPVWCDKLLSQELGHLGVQEVK